MRSSNSLRLRATVPSFLGAVVVAAAPLFLSGCSLLKTDKAKVGDFLAARLWEEDRYERACVPVKPDVSFARCEEMQRLLKDWKHLNGVANAAQKLGDLPPEAKKEIRTVWKKVSRLP
jgi:hypothetical protein